ncbi:hypothetical protein M422DRAFT_263301 [Sphaerobolus stellatus SS14]|uniref:Uncharacterized protein n=1 Tax=Sphaerobolus stellatus (strain SS14) TaxID=990650 RepID=A0A0C9UI55_SPHS4|nr:hypothetical protein M422DRAFT_263301 [Sphaerobolus stellatus SS14]
MISSCTPSDDEHFTDDEALNNLDAFVSSLDRGKKRKAEDDDAQPKDVGSVPRKRRLLKARTEAGAENEFGAHAASGSKLRLEDLLDPLESTSSLQALKKSTKSLAKGDSLPAPLPGRTQDRIDRAAAYEQTKEEVDKWKGTMKRIKEADHLNFPLQVPQKIALSNAALASKFQVRRVDSILKYIN